MIFMLVEIETGFILAAHSARAVRCLKARSNLPLVLARREIDLGPEVGLDVAVARAVLGLGPHTMGNACVPSNVYLLPVGNQYFLRPAGA
jgi:hypothetical protein